MCYDNDAPICPEQKIKELESEIVWLRRKVPGQHCAWFMCGDCENLVKCTDKSEFKLK